MDRLLVDTNVLIDYSKGKRDFLKKLLVKQKDGKVVLYVNPIVIAEYFTDKNLKHEEKFRESLNFINLFGVLQITKKIGILAGELMREGLVYSIGDALIAANCLLSNLALATRNKKHFEKVSDLKFLET